MSLLIESIKVLNGKCYNLALHEARANHARRSIFGMTEKIQLKKHIHIPPAFSEGLVKCRVIYDTQIHEISFTEYQVRNINKVKIIEVNDLIYNHKWADRPALDSLFEMREDGDEIIIVQNGLVTDGYYYNLVFEKDGEMYTPAIPLLHGVQRDFLLKKGRVKVANIHLYDIAKYSSIHYINAMTKLGEIVVNVSEIVW